MPRSVFALLLVLFVNLLGAAADEVQGHTHDDLRALLQDSFHAGVRERHNLASLSRSKLAHSHQMLGSKQMLGASQLLGSPAASIKTAPFPPRGTKLNRVTVDTPAGRQLPAKMNFAETLRRQFAEGVVREKNL